MAYNFGKNVIQTKNALIGKGSQPRKTRSQTPEVQKIEAISRIVITVVLLVAAVLSISFNVVPDTGKFVLGAIVGYWLS